MRRWHWWVVGFLGGISVLLAWTISNRVATPMARNVNSSPHPARMERRIFPFSVVPGGVVSAAEVARAVDQDPIVRQHYKGIQIEHLVPSRMQTSAEAYVSFRKGDRIFWTNRKIPIQKGEVVLTDGANLIRGRCGNRIALLPPTAMDEGPNEAPPEVAMETPISMPFAPPETTWPAPPTSDASSVTRASAQKPPAPLVPPVYPPVTGTCCGVPGDHPKESNPTPTPVATPTPHDTPTPPVPVPEPATLVLLAAGTMALLGARSLLARKDK